MGFPTSCDIYLEAGGEKVAVVQSYSAKPATNGKHHITLNKVRAANETVGDRLDFYTLDDFSLVVCKQDRKVIYSGCRWTRIEETGTLRAMLVERVSAVAERREKGSRD